MITIELHDEAVQAALDRIARHLTDMTPVMQDIGDLLVASTQDRVRRGEQPDGQPFAPRSPTTLKRYAKLGLSFGAPLNRSGEMREQIKFAAGADFVEIGSNAVQAAVMQFGAAKGAFGSYQGEGFGGSTPTISLPWGDIPARPFLRISDEDRDNIVAEIADWLGRIADQ